MVILEKNNYRLHTIACIEKSGFVDKPISYGLAIERSADKYPYFNYYTICSVKYNAKDQYAEIESSGTNLLDIEDNEFKLVKKLISAAIQLVEAANMED